MTATLVLSGTSSFGARPIVAKARIWAPIQSASVWVQVASASLKLEAPRTATKIWACLRLARQPVDDHRYRITGVIHEQLVAAQMRLAHRDRQLAFRGAIGFAEPRVAKRTGPSAWRNSDWANSRSAASSLS